MPLRLNVYFQVITVNERLTILVNIWRILVNVFDK